MIATTNSFLRVGLLVGLLGGLFAGPLAGVVRAQAEYSWSDLYNKSDPDEYNDFDKVAAHPDGGVVAACPTQRRTYPGIEFVSVDVVRWSASGEQLWAVHLSSQRADWWAEALLTDERGVTYVGTRGTESFHVVAIDSEGTVKWDRTLAACAVLTDLALGSCGNVVAVGKVGADADELAHDPKMFVAAWSRDGDALWSVRIPLPPYSGSGRVAVAVDAGGNIAVASGNVDIAVARLAGDGTVLWTRVIADSGALAPIEWVEDVAVAANGDVVLAGQHSRLAVLRPAYVARLDGTTGETLWERTWLGPGSTGGSTVREVEIARDGTIWAVADSMNTYWFEVLRFAADGTQMLAFQHRPADGQPSRVAGLVLGSAGQAWVAGTEMRMLTFGLPKYRAIVLQFDADSALNWARTFQSRFSIGLERFFDVAQMNDGQLVLGGTNAYLPGGQGLVMALDIGDSPQGFCESTASSLGCEPWLSFAGMPSASAASGFTVTASDATNRARGLFLYSLAGAASNSFEGGTLCLQPPVFRTPALGSGGSPPSVHDCSGAYSFDWNAFAHGQAGGNPNPALLVPGTTVWLQALGRDPGAPEHATLSNGLRYVVLL